MTSASPRSMAATIWRAASAALIELIGSVAPRLNHKNSLRSWRLNSATGFVTTQWPGARSWSAPVHDRPSAV